MLCLVSGLVGLLLVPVIRLVLAALQRRGGQSIAVHTKERRQMFIRERR